ncbi:1449_t:CDS:2, partial [Ambispora gerdemannii]
FPQSCIPGSYNRYRVRVGEPENEFTPNVLFLNDSDSISFEWMCDVELGVQKAGAEIIIYSSVDARKNGGYFFYTSNNNGQCGKGMHLTVVVIPPQEIGQGSVSSTTAYPVRATTSIIPTMSIAKPLYATITEKPSLSNEAAGGVGQGWGSLLDF